MNGSEIIRTAMFAATSLLDVLSHQTQGRKFDLFGRRLGTRLLLKGNAAGLKLMARPVVLDRYWEYPFVHSCIPCSAKTCLDLSSPNLVSLYYARERASKGTVVMCNPDADDIAETRLLASSLRLSNLRTICGDALSVLTEPGQFDCIWAISVLEHISGSYDDREALRVMLKCVRPGGRVILTVPVDRYAHDEFRSRDYYGTQSAVEGRYFFQRYYDLGSIVSRLVSAANQEPILIKWFGETVPGQYDRFIGRWIRGQGSETARSARYARRNFREFSSWSEMPGKGVCGLVFERPRE